MNLDDELIPSYEGERIGEAVKTEIDAERRIYDSPVETNETAKNLLSDLYRKITDRINKLTGW